VAAVRLVLAAVGLLALAGWGSSGPGVQTLYRSSHRTIAAFAQDGQLIAWLSAGTGACNAVHVLSLRGVEVTLPKPGTNNVTCRWTMGSAPVDLVVASDTGSALWTLHERTAVELDYVVGADVSQPRERRFSQLAHTRAGAGLWLGGIAGEGKTLVYSFTTVGYVNQVACLSGGSCRRRIVGGGVRRIVGRHNPLVPGTEAALGIATAGGRIAYTPAAAVSSTGRPVASDSLPIDVLDAVTGALVSQAQPDGEPLAVALSANRLVVLERSNGKLHVCWYDLATGDQLGTVRVPQHTSAELTTSDHMAAYHVGRTIDGVDLDSGREQVLARAATTPIGLSLVGTRLAWAENVKGTGRIRALIVGSS